MRADHSDWCPVVGEWVLAGEAGRWIMARVLEVFETFIHPNMGLTPCGDVTMAKCRLYPAGLPSSVEVMAVHLLAPMPGADECAFAQAAATLTEHLTQPTQAAA